MNLPTVSISVSKLSNLVESDNDNQKKKTRGRKPKGYYDLPENANELKEKNRKLEERKMKQEKKIQREKEIQKKEEEKESERQSQHTQSHLEHPEAIPEEIPGQRQSYISQIEPKIQEKKQSIFSVKKKDPLPVHTFGVEVDTNTNTDQSKHNEYDVNESNTPNTPNTPTVDKCINKGTNKRSNKESNSLFRKVSTIDELTNNSSKKKKKEKNANDIMFAVQNLHNQIDQFGSNSVMKLKIPEDAILEIENGHKIVANTSEFNDIYQNISFQSSSSSSSSSSNKNNKISNFGNEEFLNRCFTGTEVYQHEFNGCKVFNKQNRIFKIPDKICNETGNKVIICNNCCHIVKDLYSMPIKKTHKEYKTSFCFCQPECMVSYLFRSSQFSSYDKDRIYTWINELYSKKDDFGNLVPIQEALNLNLLDIYGGPYDIQKFREKSTNYAKHISMHYLPHTPNIGYISEITVDYKKVNHHQENTQKNVPKEPTSEYRVQRPKPRPRNTSIEKSFNITIQSTS